MANPYKVVAEFEEKIADWAGSKYAVAVESGTAAIFLSCVYNQVSEVIIPKYTYPSVPCSIIHAGGKVKFSDEDWSEIYELRPYKIYDSALKFQRGMYKDGFHCLSFHIKKSLPIGRGGMILLNDKTAYEWLKRARFDGRSETPLEDGDITMLGWNLYMTPEQAIRGLQLFELIKNKDIKSLDSHAQGYPDLSQYPFYEN